MAAMSPLRRRMIEDMTVRNLSTATQRSYVHAVAEFSQYFGKPPDQLSLEDVRAYQVHLASKGLAWASFNQIVCALRFFYGVTLGRAEMPERIAYAREPRRLPVVLSAEEVVRFLEAVPGLKSRAALTTAYAAGLRVSEVVALKVGDIDSKRMVSSVARAARNAMPCCQLNFCASCAPTGAWRGHSIGCSPVATPYIRSIRRCFTPPVDRRGKRRAPPTTSRSLCSPKPLRPIFCRPPPTPS